MDADFFPVQDSVLSAQAIADRLLPLYGLTSPYACRFFRKGICDTYQIQTGAGAYYLKVYRAGRRAFCDVSEEVRLLGHLLAHGVPVVRPAARLDGGYVHEFTAPEGARCAVLFHAVAGEEERTDQHRRAFGAVVARMHAAADLLTPAYDRQPLDMGALVEENMVHIGRLMAHRPKDLGLLREIADAAASRIAALLPCTPPEFGICHGDLHGGDVRYDGDGLPTLLDFDSSGCGWRAVDIGVYLCHRWMDTTPEAETERQRRLAHFLDGYQTVRSLSENELAVVQATPAIRHIFLMGHVLRHTTVDQGWNWANDDFIDWHMKWFRHWHEHH
ncbi:MAG TPA: phosphotransferase [Symbiobacteriaceae bacterium]|nr:phosphotransferase [Symbiobacteriaceae bacterium]